MTAKIDKLYDSYRQMALRHCQGDTQKAEYYLDTSVYMYYYRLVQSNEYITWHNEQIKQQTKK